MPFPLFSYPAWCFERSKSAVSDVPGMTLVASTSLALACKYSSCLYLCFIICSLECDKDFMLVQYKL